MSVQSRAPGAPAPTHAWIASESAPSRYPMQLLDGHLLFERSFLPLPVRGPVNPGWGLFGSSRDIGPARKPVPRTLFVRYFSYVENAFWEGRFDLPVERLEALFAEGLTSRLSGQPITWDRVVVGAGPEGHVSLWLAVEGRVHEVSTFRAAAVELPWDRVSTDARYTRAGYVATVLREALGAAGADEALRHGAVPGRFERYRQQYPWRLDLRAQVIPSGMWMHSLNGEREWFNLMRPVPPRNARAVPYFLRLDWMDGGRRYFATVEFDEDETLRAFSDFAAAGRGDLRLEIEIGDTNRAIALYLRDAAAIYPFRAQRTRIGRRR